jgi:hypothetical protein
VKVPRHGVSRCARSVFLRARRPIRDNFIHTPLYGCGCHTAVGAVKLWVPRMAVGAMWLWVQMGTGWSALMRLLAGSVVWREAYGPRARFGMARGGAWPEGAVGFVGVALYEPLARPHASYTGACPGALHGLNFVQSSSEPALAARLTVRSDGSLSVARMAAPQRSILLGLDGPLSPPSGGEHPMVVPTLNHKQVCAGAHTSVPLRQAHGVPSLPMLGTQ